jgi:hypothetical protein
LNSLRYWAAIDNVGAGGSGACICVGDTGGKSSENNTRGLTETGNWGFEACELTETGVGRWKDGGGDGPGFDGDWG